MRLYDAGVVVALPWGEPLTYAALGEMPDDGHRRELVDGALLVSPAPGGRHQLCVARLLRVLAEAASEGLEVIPGPYDWLVSPTTVLEPDLLVIKAEDLGEAHLDSVPLLVVEVLSPSTRRTDWGTKRLSYAAAGLPWYWIVDPGVPDLAVLRLHGDVLEEQARVSGIQPYEAADPFPVKVVPADLVAPR
ncbi:MAG: Uma2 family endonuclease [Acidimicrobiales bacterium]